MINSSEANQLILSNVTSCRTASVPLKESLHKVLAEDIYADRAYPPFNRSAMDGIAIRSIDFDNGIKTYKVAETVFAGMDCNAELSEGECFKIMTGASVPASADTVIRVEDTLQEDGTATITIEKVNPGSNIAKKGEDLNQGDHLLPKGTKITPVVMSLLATVGCAEPTVFLPPSVTIITTGDEIKNVDEHVGPSEIRDSNSYSIIGMLSQLGIEDVTHLKAEDDKAILQRAVTASKDKDLLILTGGVSMGEADFVPEILQQMGIEKVFHKVAQKPGKPVWFGRNEQLTVFGLPGNPVSVQITFKLMVEAWIRKSMKMPELPILKLPFGGTKKKKNNFIHYFPCAYNYTQTLSVQPVQYNGSGDIRATALSDGIAILPENVNEISEGELIDFLPW